jgi:replicative DNA helicase
MIAHTKNRLDFLSSIYQELNYCNFSITDNIAKHFVEYDKNRNLKESNFFFEFKKAMKDYNIICLDPLIAFFGGDENSNTEARFFMNLLNDWCKKENKTILMIHHHNKGENNSVRGASAFIDAVRIHYTINKIENNSTDRLLKLEKTNHYNGEDEFTIELFKKTISNDDINIKKFEDLQQETNSNVFDFLYEDDDEEGEIDNFKDLPVRNWDEDDIVEDLTNIWEGDKKNEW